MALSQLSVGVLLSLGLDLDYEAEYLLYRLGLSLRMTRSQVIKGHLVDALALRGDEGRSTLR